MTERDRGWPQRVLAREREAADGARTRVARSRERAEAASAGQYARELWEAAETKLADAQATYQTPALLATAKSLFAAAKKADTTSIGKKIGNAEARVARESAMRIGEVSLRAQ